MYNGEVADGTHVTAGQLALALTPYAQVTELAVNTAASGNNAAAIQSLDARVTAELASKLDSPARHGRTGGRARKQHRRAAELADHGLSNKADQSAFDALEGVVATKSTPDGVDLKLSNYSTTAAMNGSIASANNATLATVAANYGLKTVVDQHSLDIAARITPLEVDTKVANAWGPSPPQRWPPSLQADTPPSRGCRPPDASALTGSWPWTLPLGWTLR